MKMDKKFLNKIKIGIFVVYIGVLVYFLFFAENLGRTTVVTNYRYNLIPFKEIRRFIVYYKLLGPFAVFANLAGNVLAFIPFGLYLPILSSNSLKFIQVTISTFCLSLTVELTQLIFKVGSFDVDDMILNTLGGMAGYLVYYCVKSVSERKHKKDEN